MSARNATSRSDDGALDRALGLLVAHRLAVYAGGLLAIVTLRALADVGGVAVPAAARTAIVAVCLSVMAVTYVGELLRRRTGDAAGASYPLRTRIATVMAIVGVAAGVYVAVSGRPVLGLMFVGGALLFGRIAFRRDR